MTPKLDHMVVLLSDMEACLPFYETLLPLIGFKKSRPHVWGNQEEIYLDLREAAEPEHGYHRHAPGLNHLGFAAGNRQAIVEIRGAMASAGFEVPEIQEFEDGSALFLKDSDGMRIEISADA